MSFNYGYMYSKIQKASIFIGPLECKGKSEDAVSGRSCQSLKLQGRPTGFYILETTNTSKNSRYICIMYLYVVDLSLKIVDVSQKCHLSRHTKLKIVFA